MMVLQLGELSFNFACFYNFLMEIFVSVMSWVPQHPQLQARERASSGATSEFMTLKKK